jgi:hypothetical protein
VPDPFRRPVRWTAANPSIRSCLVSVTPAESHDRYINDPETPHVAQIDEASVVAVESGPRKCLG